MTANTRTIAKIREYTGKDRHVLPARSSGLVWWARVKALTDLFVLADENAKYLAGMVGHGGRSEPRTLPAQ